MNQPQAGWAAPLPRRPSDRWRALAPAILLLVIALLGVRNHVVRDQSSWQGASFGMFATYDNRISRSVLVTVEQAGELRPVRLPEDLRDDAERLAVVPTEGAALALAEAVLERFEGPSMVRVQVRRINLGDDGDLRVVLEDLADASASR